MVSQLAGLGLGIASLLRIRRASRLGLELRGRGWALAGILTSGFALLSWIAVCALLLTVKGSLSHSREALTTITPTGH